MNLFDLFKIKKKSTENYFDSIIKEKKENLYSFDKRYMNQESKLLKMYVKSNT